MQDPRDRLLLSARMRAALRMLTTQRALAPDVAASVSNQLDAIDTGALRELDGELQALPDLLVQCEKAGLDVDVSVLRGALRTARLQDLDALRMGGQTTGAIRDYSPTVAYIALGDFDWPDLQRRWRELASAVLDTSVTLDALTATAQQFFAASEGSASVPVRFDPGLGRIIPRLIKVRALRPEQASARLEDIQLARDALKDAIAAAHLELGMDGSLHGASEAEFAALETFTALKDATVDVAPALAAWRGPFFLELADRWLRNRAEESDAALQQAAELLYARTGVDAYSQRAQWNALVAQRKSHEHEQLLNLRAIGNDEAAVAGLGFMLGQRATPPEHVREHWWPLVQGLRAFHAPAASAAPERAGHAHTTSPGLVLGAVVAASTHTSPGTGPGAEPGPGAETAPSAAPPPQVTPTARPAFEYVSANAGERNEATRGAEVLPEDDAEFVAAPEKAANADDEIVESKSTWSVYLRPFLSENWLGLIGVTSLMAAWMFLTMWLWDKGQSYRIGMGAVPLLGLTLGTAWAARFIAKLPDAAPRAVALFSALALLSIPFNFALGATLLGIDSSVARTAGAVLGLVYIAATPWVSARIEPAFGHDTRRYLLEINVVGYAPALVALFMGPRWIEPALGALIFVTLAALTRGLLRARQNPDTFGLSWMLFAGVYLLVNAIPHVFFRVVPSAEIVALGAQAVALVVAGFGAQRPMALFIGALISASGLLLALVNPAWLPLICLAATGFWWLQSRAMKAGWITEILVVHIIGTALALAWWLDTLEYAALFVVGAMVIVTRVETRSTTETLHYTLPLTLLGAALMAGLVSTDIAMLANGLAVVACAVWAHLRFSNAFRTGLYLTNVALATLGAYAALQVGIGMKYGLQHAGIEDQVVAFALYMAAVAAVWAVGSAWLRDPLTRAHKTLVTWSLGAVAAIATIVVADLVGLLQSLPLQLAVLATALALVIAAARSRSVLPSYAGLIVITVAALILKVELDLGSSGLGSASAATAALLLASVLRRWRALEAWPTQVDHLFGKPFPGTSKHPFADPLEVAALVAAVATLVKSLELFTELGAMPKTGIALCLAALVLARLAYVRRFAWLGYAAFATLGVLIASLMLEVDEKLWPHALLGWLTLAVLLSMRLARTHEALRASLGTPLRHLTMVATLLSIPAALLAYPVLLLAEAGAALTGLWFVAATAFVIVFIVPLRPRWLVHLALLHVSIGWTLAFLFATNTYLEAVQVNHLLAGAFVLMLIVAIAFETSTSPLRQAYVRGAWGWLTAFAVAAFTVGLLLSIDAASGLIGLAAELRESGTWLEPLLCALALELVCRRWRHGVLSLAKALSLVWFANVLIIGAAYAPYVPERGEHLPALLAGLFLFIALEALWTKLAAAFGERLRTVPFVTPDPSAAKHQANIIVYAGIVCMVGLHIALMATREASEVVEHYWLYGAAALALWLYVRERVQLGLYTGSGLFVYTNCFMAMAWLPNLPLQDVGALHALAAAFVVSLACFLALSTWMRRGEVG